jgi:uncharacterized membrane protein YhaH (DUF805 family)
VSPESPQERRAASVQQRPPVKLFLIGGQVSWISDLLTFRGTIGRARLWLTCIVCGLLLFLPAPVPSGNIFHHQYSTGLVLWIVWPTAAEPLTGKLLTGSYDLFVLLVLWILAAAFARRLHDRGYEARWWLILFGADLAVFLLLSIVVDHPDKALAPLDAFVIAGCLLPVVVGGGLVGQELFYYPRAPGVRPALSSDDLRNSLP